MKSTKVVIVDYGIGNLFSVRRALEVCGANNIIISSKPKDILRADRVVLPGVGAFADGIQGLRDRALDVAILEFSDTKRPLLGICLGMQILATTSKEFGYHSGLDLIPGKVVAIPTVDKSGSLLKTPYVGWSSLDQPANSRWTSTVLSHISQDHSVYLVHSFQFIPDNPNDLLATYRYGGHEITAAIIRENITGLQFHPEKSGKVGLSILSEFLQC